ncbi:MAG: FxsA family protein [Planctomycetota bacterium]
MLGWLLLVFITVPVVEIYLLFVVAGAIGWGPTLAIAVFTGILGSALVRHQGLRTLRLIQEDLAEGRLPTDRILSGLFLLIGGAFLITPGILTDAAGFLLMAPGIRRLPARWLKIRLQARLREDARGPIFFFHKGFGREAPRPLPPYDIEGTAERVEGEKDGKGT